jgi:tetratricopeptide (TPR) repeat protein
MGRTFALICFLCLWTPSIAFADDFQKAIAAAEKEDWDHAIECLTEHIRNHPKDADAYMGRGNVYESKGDLTKAIADYSKAIELEPEDAICLCQRALAFVRLKAYDKAVLDFSEVIRLEPEEELVYRHRALVYWAMRDFENALTDYDKAIKIEPSAAAYGCRGSVYFELKKYGKAIHDLSEAIRLDPKLVLALANRGSAYSAIGAYDKAVVDCNAAVQADPTNYLANWSLAWLLATCPKDNIRDGEQAVKRATIACEQSDWKSPHILGALAAAYAEKGNFKEAIKWQEKAISIKYALSGDQDEARARLKLYKDGKPFRQKPVD